MIANSGEMWQDGQGGITAWEWTETFFFNAVTEKAIKKMV